MESLEQLRKQLQSLEDLRAIVKTMKALSAASIRQYEEAAEALSGYHQTVRRGLQAIFEHGPPVTAPSRRQGAGGVGAVVFGSDLGLCGRFNEEVTEFAREQLGALRDAPGGGAALAVGARVASSLEREGETPEEVFHVPGSAEQITGTVRAVLLKLDDWRQSAAVGEVHLFYNRHSGGSSYQPTSLRLLPIDLADIRARQEEGWPSRSLPTHSMERGRLLSRLLRQYLFVSLFRATAESLASEHASRLAAMQSAERNLDERLGDVTRDFRRARQMAITSELLDVVAGFEATTGEGH